VRQKRAIWIMLLCAALVGALFISPVPASADSFTVTFDEGGHAYTIVVGMLDGPGGDYGESYYGGNFVRSTQAPSANDCSAISSLEVDIPVNPWDTITGVAAGDAKFGDPPTATYFTQVLTLKSGGSTLYTNSRQVGPLNNWNDYPLSGLNWTGGDTLTVQNAICWASPNFRLGIDNITITYTAGSEPATPTLTPTATPNPLPTSWSKPLRHIDQKSDDVSFHPGRYYSTSLGSQIVSFNPLEPDAVMNVGFSQTPGVNVFAVQEGVIDSVQPLNACASVDGYCLIWWNTQLSNTYYYALQRGAYLISESLNDGRHVNYILQTPRVVAGDTVSAGCLLGSTLSLKIITMFQLTAEPVSEGAVFVQGVAEDGVSAFDLSPLLSVEPAGTACHVVNSECALVNNPAFTGTRGWERHPDQPDLPFSVSEFGSGMAFPGAAQQLLNLDSAQQYSITIQYSVDEHAPPQAFTIQLGNEIATVALADGRHNQRTTDAATFTTDRPDGLYVFGAYAQPGEADQAWLEFVCVSEAGTAPPSPVGGCLVVDPYFNQRFADSPWTASADPLAVVPGGMAVVPDGGSIRQAITLNPGEGGANVDYDLQVTYRRQGIASDGHSISLGWQFGTASGTLTPASTTQTWAEVTDTFGLATASETAPLILTAHGSHPTEAAQIAKVCIVPHQGGTAPGYQPPAPFTGGCRYCVYSPTGDVATDLSEFQQWLSCQFFQLWECQAKILLRYIWQTLVNILTILGFFRLWLSATLINLVAWGNGNLLVFLRWLDGQISNAVTNITLAILNWHDSAGGGATIWDFLIALVNGLVEILKALVSLVGSIVQLILSGIIGFLVNGLGGFLSMIQSVLNGIAASSSQVQVDWLPNCADPQSALFVICAASAGIEQELSLTPIPMLVPVILGAGAFGLIWWAINRFIRAVTGEGE
jgi:hypothetical protein